MEKILCAVFVLGFVADKLCAESYSPFADRRIVDPMSNFYVVVKRQGGPRHRDSCGPVELKIVQHNPRDLPILPGRARVVEVQGLDTVYEMQAGERVAVREGDVVLGRLKLDDPPSTILISSTGLGLVLLDLYGLNYTLFSRKDPAITVVSLKGKILHQRSLFSLFSEKEIPLFQRSLSNCIFWLRCAWIDEEKQQIVVVGRNSTLKGTDPVAVISFQEGTVRPGGTKEVMRAISTKNPGGLTNALDFAIRWNLKEAKPYLPEILANPGLPLEARLRAAVFLASMGDKRGKELLAAAALSASKQLLQYPDWQDIENERLWDIVDYGFKHLPHLLGDEALPVLREIARPLHYPAIAHATFCQLDKKSVVFLVEMLQDQNDTEGQVFAASVFSEIKPDTKAAISALTKALHSPATSRSGCPLRWVAALALGNIGSTAKSALPTLSKLANDPDEDVRKAALEAKNKIKQ